MKTKLLFSTALLLALGSTTFAETKSGRQLDVIAFSNNVTTLPSTGTEELFLERPIVGIFWDERCASVEYTFNSNVGANPGGVDEIAPATLANIVQTGLNRWNDNPSSYINLEVTSVRDLGARPRIGGDFINEVTFITPGDFGALASSPSTSLLSDDTFVAGEDLDGDGDADVFDPEAAARNTCFDIDGDGDIEFPAGDYLAGTILDNDVQFSSTVLWETTSTNPAAADIDAVSTHEFGHSHGLSHAIINQFSENDGTTSTMFPFININQANSEIATRTLSSDDLSASSFLYPEGKGNLPISEIQDGDIHFDQAYQVITGNTFSGSDTPLSGAAVKMTNRLSGEIVSQTYSGRTSAFQNLNGNLLVFPESIVNGSYSIPVPRATLLTASIEALDGSPIAAGNVSLNAIISDILGVTSFPEEAWDANDRNIELRPSAEVPFSSFRNRDVNFVVNEELTQRNAGGIDFGGTGAIFGANDIVYAELFDRDTVSQLIAEGNTPISGNAETFLILENASVAEFSKAQLAIGKINAEGNVDISRILSTRRDIVVQDSDNSVFTFVAPESLPFRIRNAFNQDPDAQLFFLLEINDVPVGPNAGFPLAFVGVDVGIGGTSFLSLDNGPLQPFVGQTFAMELRYVNTGRPVPRYLQDIRN